MNVAIYIIMILAAGGMLWAHQQYNAKGVAWGRPLAGLCGVVTVLMAFAAIWVQFNSQKWKSKDLMEKEAMYQDMAWEVFGRRVAKVADGRTMLVITPYMIEGNRENHERTMAAFKKGLGMSVSIDDFVSVQELYKAEMERDRQARIEAGEEVPEEEPMDEMEPGMDEMDMMMMDAHLTAKTFDRLVEEYPHCDAIFSMVGLPWDYQEMQFWTKTSADRRPKLILQNAELSSPGLLYFMTVEQTIVAVMMNSPNAVYDPDAEVPEDPEVAFQQRYIFISPDNLFSNMKKYPELFGFEDQSKAEEKIQGLKNQMIDAGVLVEEPAEEEMDPEMMEEEM